MNLNFPAKNLVLKIGNEAYTGLNRPRILKYSVGNIMSLKVFVVMFEGFKDLVQCKILPDIPLMSQCGNYILSNLAQ